jgi:hypothetical protein
MDIVAATPTCHTMVEGKIGDFELKLEVPIGWC